MAMLKTVLSAGALIAGTAFITAQVVSGPEKAMDREVQKAKDAMQDMTGSPEMQEMMKRWEQFATPAAHHAHLKALEGKWDLKVTSWMADGAPPSVSTASSSAKMILGGRYLMEKVEGEGMDFGDGNKLPFEGMAISGFNNGTQEIFSFWVDNMGTGHMLDTGTMSDDGKLIETKGEMFCPMRGKMCQGKTRITMVDANTRKMEMWAPDMATGNMYKNMEIVYTRAK